MKKSYIKMAVRIGASLAFVAFFVFKFDSTQILHALGYLSAPVICGAIVLYIFAFFIAAMKWHLLLPEYSIGKLFRFIFVGQFYSLVLPGQIFGELAKTYRVTRNKEEVERVFASVWVDKITGLIALLLVSFSGILFTHTLLPKGFSVSIGVVILVGIAALFSVRFSFFQKFISDILQFIIPRRFDWLRKKILLFLNDWNAYSVQYPLIFSSVLLGACFQFCAIFIVMLFAHDIGITVSLADWSWIFGAVSMALLLPITIGGLGLRDGVMVGMLVWLGVRPEHALAVSFSLFGVQAFGALIGGVSEFFSTFTKRTS